MNKISNIVSQMQGSQKADNDFEINEEKFIAQLNSKKGDLNLEDNIECDICNNKGYVYSLVDGNRVAKECKCMVARKTMRRLKNSNIPEELLKKYTFKNFETTEEWQKQLLNSCINYAKEIINNDKKYWLCISSITGSGKTHLATAIFQSIIKKKLIDGEYLLWNDFCSKIIPLSKSVIESQSLKYEQVMQRLITVDLLYIDDMFKLTESKYSNDSIALLYKIINQRYINNKITIITTEYSQTEVNDIDSAICGRISEKCDFGNWWFNLKKDPSRNYRLKRKNDF